MKAVLVDSSFLFALYNIKDKQHIPSQITAARLKGQILLVEPCLTEVAFLFNRLGGSVAVARFMQVFAASQIPFNPLSPTDLQRGAEIMLSYPAARLDFVDCLLMALAERLDIMQICTYDRRDFSLVRPKHCPYFELLP
jgi:uncharacterized protein